MALHLHRAERTDLLVDGLAELLAAPQSDPFAEELVLVPARGVERWLSQRLSHVVGRGAGADGVCAGVRFRSPRSLVAELIGSDADDPWAPDALVWPLLSVIDGSLDQPWCTTLAAHLGHFHDGDEAELRRGRRYAVARRIAGLFASYAAQRPQLLIDWTAGDHTDGAGRILDEDLAWQPRLWRLLLERVDADPPQLRHRKTVDRLRNSSQPQLPARLSLFGHTRLPATDIELLDALATHHDLHLWLPHPSDQLWRALAETRGPVPRRTDTAHQRAGNPLLATLGRDLRELQATLQSGRTATVVEQVAAPVVRPDTLLGWLQADIRANAVRPGTRTLTPEDRSIQVHSCHGPARQIDVLREVLLGLLADDPTLEPRDILVMCPDIESYAPLISAGFGLGEVAPGGHPAHRLRVRLADRSLTQTNALLAVADQLLSLAGGRATASEVLNFATAEPVRARFDFTDDDLDTLTAWTREAGVRWGFDSAHRAPYHLDGIVQNTWRFGLDRVLSGVAMSDDSGAWIGTTLPLDDVGSNRVELAGRFAEFVERLGDTVAALSGARPLTDWLTALREGVGALTRVGGDEAWQQAQLHREFAGVLARAGEHAGTELRLADIRALLRDHLAGRPTRANFRTGTLTVCTMVPMRSVPHRVVCLVGLDDGVFPRQGLVDGDDVLARQPMTGERDIRSEDRQLLLDAVCAATERLVITYTGYNEHTGAARPPAVPLMELLDALDRTTANPVRDSILTRQPLQPFDKRNVIPGELGIPGQPFTFDTTALAAARAALGDRPAPEPFYRAPLPAPPPDDVSVADLLGFFRDPVRGFFRALDYTLPWDVDGIDDAMPVEVNALQEWGIGDRMLGDMLRGMHPEDAVNAEWRRGVLPPGRLGWRKAKEIRDQAREIAVAAMQYRVPAASAHDIDVDLGGGRRLTGTVSGVYQQRIVSVTYSKLGPKQLLAAWIRLLALAANTPETAWAAVAVGRGKRSGVLTRALAAPADPIAVLRDLVELYDAGRREPLPLPVKTSFAWAEARFAGGYPERDAGYRWRTGRYPAEDQDVAYVKVWGPHAPLSALLGPPLPGEEMPGEQTRLGALSARLWLPMLRAEGSEP